MHLPWFKRVGIFFIPVALIGWIILLASIVYAVYIFIDIDSKSHSVSDTLINFVFNALIIAAVYSLIAYLTRQKPGGQVLIYSLCIFYVYNATVREELYGSYLLKYSTIRFASYLRQKTKRIVIDLISLLKEKCSLTNE